MNKTAVLGVLFLLLLSINSVPYIGIDFFIEFKYCIGFLNIMSGFLFILIFVRQIYDFNNKKILVNKLLKTGKNESIKKMKFDKENDLYKILKRTYIAKNLLEKNIEEIKQNFNKLVPKEFIKGIGKGISDELKIGLSVKKELHIMFIDISGFTKITEDINGDKVLILLNIYFNGIVEITKKNGGYVDKFLGDGIMIVFDSIESDGIIKTAVEVLKLIKKINIGEYKNKIKMGIGINSGEVVLGTIGSKNRMDISIIGDTVNIASKIEHLTRDNKHWIIITENTYNLLKEKERFKINKIGEKNIKGRKKNILLYGIQL